MIFLPGNLIQPDGFQKFHDVFAPVVMGRTIVILAHEDDGHVGEEAGEGPARVYQAGGVAGDFRPYGYDGEGHALFDDDGSVYGHGKPLLLWVMLLFHFSREGRRGQENVYFVYRQKLDDAL
jgi:hypothetical protein